MGLGKTIQSITLLSEIYAAGIQGPFLVIAPLSTITNWEREFSTWTNMNAIVYHGSLASRQMIQQYEMYCKDEKVDCWSVMRTLAGNWRPYNDNYPFLCRITWSPGLISSTPWSQPLRWFCRTAQSWGRSPGAALSLTKPIALRIVTASFWTVWRWWTRSANWNYNNRNLFFSKRMSSKEPEAFSY